MAILRIITEENETLRKISKPVGEVTDRIKQLLDDMKDTLAKAGGVGLAAPQVGILRRMFIINQGIEEEKDDFVEFIDPEILSVSGSQNDVEGCLSSPDKYGYVERPMSVTVRAKDRFGKTFEYTGTELMGRCLSHEYDHLDGILFIDKVTEYVDPDAEEQPEQTEKNGKKPPHRRLRRHSGRK